MIREMHDGTQREAAVDAGYRSLASAIVLQAVRDTTDPRQSQEAMDFLASRRCKTLLRLAGIRWMATDVDVSQAALRLQGRRSRHHSTSVRSLTKKS